IRTPSATCPVASSGSMGSPAPRATRCAGATPSAYSAYRAAQSVAQLAPGKLDKEVFEIRRTMQVADAGLFGEIRQQRRRIARVAERVLAGELEALGELPSPRVRPRSRFVAVYLDHFGFDVRGDQRARR